MKNEIILLELDFCRISCSFTGWWRFATLLYSSTDFWIHGMTNGW